MDDDEQKDNSWNTANLWNTFRAEDQTLSQSPEKRKPEKSFGKNDSIKKGKIISLGKIR